MLEHPCQRRNQAKTEGESDPKRLAAFAVGRVRAEPEELEAALVGRVTDHHRFLLKEQLTQITQLDLAIGRVTAEIVRRFPPPPSPQETERSETTRSTSHESPVASQKPVFPSPPQPLRPEAAVALLCTIPGISEVAARGILAEIGITMQQFPTAVLLCKNNAMY